ncbi:hypothetical protein ACWCRF_24030 [Streptomyces sp. NPDC002405]|uniref:hypothetical protein n=1 Tax=Streptomyces sp. NPDC057596 TaxID=3346178 RepID=UPI0036B0214D
MPLRAQYADDLLKLGLLGEAQQLFDPDRYACPARLKRLPPGRRGRAVQSRPDRC